MFDMNSVPISGGIIVAGALWAGASAFALGPLVTERELIRDGWLATCELDLKADINTRREPSVSAVPEIDCESTFGTFFGPDGKDLCRNYGNFDISVPGLEVLREQERRAEAAKTRRIQRAASKAGSRCTCAASVYLSEHRLPLALYAGSGRLITPPQVKARSAELSRALHSPACILKLEG